MMILKSYKMSPHEKQQCLTLLILLGNPQTFSMPAAAATKSLQSYLTLGDLMDCSLPGFSVHGILQARTLEWVAISFSNA